MERYLTKHVTKYAQNKIIFISGPRQTGKTTLSKKLFEDFLYLNFDSLPDRIFLKNQTWDRTKKAVIFDEIHKMKNWKSWLKGIFDKEGSTPKILVTGSAKLNTARKVGDSLAGRFLNYRLHPLDLKELDACSSETELDSWNRLKKLSGFPEPFFANDEEFYKLWSRSHLDIILRQDLLDLESVKSMVAIEDLVGLLARRVGSQISFANLAQDLSVDPKTVKRWIEILENLFVFFRITPYSPKLSRMITKQPRLFFFDSCRIQSQKGAQLENLVACALVKEIDFLADTKGLNFSLHYLRDKEKHEVDFLICYDRKPTLLIEVKSQDTARHFGLDYFAPRLKIKYRFQLVDGLKEDINYPDGHKIVSMEKFLTNLNLLQYVAAT